MGQAFSEPVTEKESTTDKNEQFLVASSSIQGWRISMEDAHTILLSLPDDDQSSFFAVFDGHGGAKVANYASENLFRVLTSNKFYRDGHIEDALKNVFVEFDEMMFNDEKMRDELAGSTAVIVLIKNGQIYCANIGDSRAVASFAGQVDPLSIDHKPTCPDEMNRIVSAGGWVQFNRVNGNLALSRAFGDFVFKRNDKLPATEQIVVAYPDVQTRLLSDDLEFIVLACDGVWDVMTNVEVVEFVRRRIIYKMEPVAICEELITRCLAPDCQMGFGIGCDNMTVILVCYLNGATYEEYCLQVASVQLNSNNTSERNNLPSYGVTPSGINYDSDSSDSSTSSLDEIFTENNTSSAVVVTPMSTTTTTTTTTANSVNQIKSNSTIDGGTLCTVSTTIVSPTGNKNSKLLENKYTTEANVSLRLIDNLYNTNIIGNNKQTSPVDVTTVTKTSTATTGTVTPIQSVSTTIT